MNDNDNNTLYASLVNINNTSIREKEKELFTNRIEIEYNEMLKRKEEELKAKTIDLSKRDVDRINKIQSDNQEYLERARGSKVFINDDFKGKVPYFARNIILIAAETGEGKSTTCANLSAHALMQGQKVLVLTNEENVSDVYNRVTCLIKGWSYSNHENFTNEQIQVFSKYINVLSHRLTVIDDAFNDSIGQTTSLEGVETILSNLVENKIKFDVVILDYYQNIDKSITVPSLKDWEVQGRMAKFFDKFKNAYDAPLIILAQKKQNSDNMSFKESIEGRKAILNIATCAIEMKADRENRRTSWTIKKSRFVEAVGSAVYTGYKKGKYVPYTKEFQNEVAIWKNAEKDSETLKLIRPESKNGGSNGDQKN